jgi:rhodanese-related sulfurtransferase
MKKGFKLGAASLAALMVFGAAGCGKDGITAKEGQKWAEKNGYVKSGYAEGLPSSVKDTAACDGVDSKTKYGNGCAGISGSNLKDYLGRKDVVYIDVRDDGSAGDSSTALTEYAAGHLKGFKSVEFFDVIYNGGTKGTQLFYKAGDKDSVTPIFAPRYADSVEMLEELFPKDKTLFLMCAGGGRVVTLMQLLDQYGWDMTQVYNVGGWSMYDDEAAYKDYRVTTNITLAEYDGTAAGKTQGTTGDDISASVKVLLNPQTYTIGGAYLTGGTVASATYAEEFTAELTDLFASMVGLTVEEIRAKVTAEGTLADGVDVVGGATHSTTLIYKAVINALSTVVVE